MKKGNLTLLKILLLFFVIISFSYCGNKSRGGSSSTYTEPVPACKPSTSKVRSLVSSNWSSIQSKASFTISDKKSFEIKNYGLDGDELAVNVKSEGYFYDISFTVSFNAYFNDDCALKGSVADVYNYKKE